MIICRHLGNVPKNCIFFRDGNENQTHVTLFVSCLHLEQKSIKLIFALTHHACADMSPCPWVTLIEYSVHRPRLRDIRPNTRWSRTRWRDRRRTWRNSGGKVKERTLQSMRVKRTRYVCFNNTYIHAHLWIWKIKTNKYHWQKLS